MKGRIILLKGTKIPLKGRVIYLRDSTIPVRGRKWPRGRGGDDLKGQINM
jgi:hypothetical protein